MDEQKMTDLGDLFREMAVLEDLIEDAQEKNDCALKYLMERYRSNYNYVRKHCHYGEDIGD